MLIPREIYQQIVEYAAIPTVDIIFLDKDKKVLLWLRTNEPLQWSYYIPGWRIEKGETIIQAALRKAKEETSLIIDETKLQFVGTYDDIFDSSAFIWLSTHCIPSIFVYRLDEHEVPHIHCDSQHSEMKFFAYNDVLLHPHLQSRLAHIQSVYHIFNS